MWGPGRLVAASSSTANYNGVKCNGVSNVIWDVDIIGNKETHVGDGSQGCHSIRVSGGSNIQILSAVKDCPGDGIYVYGGASNVTIALNVTNCGRHGATVVQGSDVHFTQAGGTNITSSLIDIEPNAGLEVSGTVIENISANNCGKAVNATTAAAGSSIPDLTIQHGTADGCTNSSASAGSLDFRGVGALTLTDLIVQNGASHGIRMEDMGIVVGTDIHSLNNAGYGYVADEQITPMGAADYTFTDSDASGNTSGGASWVHVTPTLNNCTGME